MFTTVGSGFYLDGSPIIFDWGPRYDSQKMAQAKRAKGKAETSAAIAAGLFAVPDPVVSGVGATAGLVLGGGPHGAAVGAKAALVANYVVIGSYVARSLYYTRRSRRLTRAARVA